MGLSPHTRGKLIFTNAGSGSLGPIPAYAGETPHAARIICSSAAYPRIRGGNYVPGSPETKGLGLSPHTRGKRRVSLCYQSPIGPIPAYAGETTVTIVPFTVGGAYPRIRGGNVAP